MSAEKNREQLEHMLRMYTQGRASSEVVAAVIQARAVLALADAVREVGALLAASDVVPFIDESGLPSEGGMSVRPGDPDPTPDYPDGGFCGAQKPGGGSQTCTWPAGHDGAHVAGNGAIAVEVWS